LVEAPLRAGGSPLDVLFTHLTEGRHAYTMPFWLPLTLMKAPPLDWVRISSKLRGAWMRKNDPSVPPPPRPLVLAGAAFSTESEIWRRWIGLIMWANQFGYARMMARHLPEHLKEELAKHDCTKPPPPLPPIYRSLIDGGSFHVAPRTPPEPVCTQRPSRELVIETRQRLRENWAEIAGPELHLITWPLRFAGRKRRRLILQVNPLVKPPWGNWYSWRWRPRERTTFTARIERAILPMRIEELTFAEGLHVQYRPRNGGI
jgi:hypothetical protein